MDKSEFTAKISLPEELSLRLLREARARNITVTKLIQDLLDNKDEKELISDLSDYQRQAVEFRLDTANTLEYLTLGLCGEAGEVAELIKKSIRNNTRVDEGKLRMELGDVLWYLANISEYIKHDLTAIAQLNIMKLNDRYKGSNDYR